MYWHVIYPVCRFYCSCLSKRLIRRQLMQISVFISPYKLRRTKNMNSTVFFFSYPLESYSFFIFNTLRHVANIICILSLRKQIVDWFHMTLYTRVLVNTTKVMKDSPILGFTFLHQYLKFFWVPAAWITFSTPSQEYLDNNTSQNKLLCLMMINQWMFS